MEAANTGEATSPGSAGTPPSGEHDSTMEDLRSALAEALRKVATRLQDEAQADAPGEGDSAEGDPVEGASPAADWLNRSADYVEQVDLDGIKRIKSTVDDEVRRHPGRSLLVAGAAGLVLGLLLRRR